MIHPSHPPPPFFFFRFLKLILLPFTNYLLSLRILRSCYSYSYSYSYLSTRTDTHYLLYACMACMRVFVYAYILAGLFTKHQASIIPRLQIKQKHSINHQGISLRSLLTYFTFLTVEREREKEREGGMGSYFIPYLMYSKLLYVSCKRGGCPVGEQHRSNPPPPPPPPPPGMLA